MTHRAVSLLAPTLVCALLASSAAAQVDYAAIRAGVAGCPEIAADPSLGSLGALLCRPVDRTTLDLPINAVNKFFEVRAGVYSRVNREFLLSAARGVIGESEYTRLRGLVLAGDVLSSSQNALRNALLAQAADPATPPATAAQLLALANGIVAGTFDESAPTLLATRIDRNRILDLRNGLLRAAGARDVITSFEPALVTSLTGFVSFGTSLPVAFDADGDSIFRQELATVGMYPTFLGPDGVASTADDLPYVATNPAAQSAGYSLGPPISGTSQDRFDLTSGGVPIYTATAKRTVDDINQPGAQKTVELYGVYNPVFLVRTGCLQGGLGGTFDSATGTCSAGGNDVTALARTKGCSIRAARGTSMGLPGVGTNADGDCIELNTASASGSTVQFELLPLYADPVTRLASASLEPVDLTDLYLRARGIAGLPARPPGPSGNVAFPNLPAAFGRRVDLLTGAPTGPEPDAQCRVRVDGSSVPIGPNGVAGDGDDAVPSAGGCLLWAAPPASGAQSREPATAVAANAAANQSLFHTLCTLSFQGDRGSCPSDSFDDPRSFGLVANLLGGVGALGGVLLDGVETIRTDPTSVLRRQSPGPFATMFQSINPDVPNPQIATYQDFGLVAESAQTALLGCGLPFASPCSSNQAELWAADAALGSALGSPQQGGIDLMNAAASVLVQEFAAVKALKADSLVGTTATQTNDLAYLPGVNFSRDGSFGTRPAPGGGTVPVENGAYLALTPADVIALGPSGRASYQHGGANKVQADGWAEPMPWAVDPGPLAQYGAVVFEVDPNDPFAGQGNSFVAGGEYCGRWMLGSEAETETPFNQTCTLLESVSANLERGLIAPAEVGQDRVFDPPETVAELVAMLDGDPANDATGDPVAGPDGIFARNQRVFSATEMDFEVVAGRDGSALGAVQIVTPPADPAAALAFLLAYDPAVSCASVFCSLQVNDVLSDPGDAQSTFPLLLALPIGANVDVIVGGVPTAVTKLNLAALSLQDRHGLNRLLAGEVVAVGAQSVRMNADQRTTLLGRFGDQNVRGLDLDGDGTTDLDRDRDGVYDGVDDFTPGPVSDDEILCGSGLPGDKLQDGIQFEPWSDAEAPGSAAFVAALPNGLAPRSPVFCRALNQILAATGPSAAQSDAFLWHGGAPPAGSDQDADGWPDAIDSCPAQPNADQADADADGVGDTCDNCVTRANPRVAAGFLAANPWATLTGGQRDDDHDGYGNACDGKFPGASGTLVGAADLTQFRTSNGRSRAGDTCGTDHARPCAIFDLDETGLLIGSADLARFRALVGKLPGPKCPSCPLTCEAGAQGTCN